MNKKIILRQMLSGIILFTLLTSNIILVSTNADAETNEANMLPSIRIYGESLYPAYPNQAFYLYWTILMDRSNDFIYNYGEDPFDPGVLSKDSITFNPAYLSMDKYKDEYISVNGGDAAEKVSLRMFYQPDYWHPVDKKMDDCSKSVLEPIETMNAVVLETTYSLITPGLSPIPGNAGITHFVLPYTFTDPDTPGMNSAAVVDLIDVQKPYKQECGGQITVKESFEEISSGTTINFMDHDFTFKNYQVNLNQVKVNVKYSGNMYGAHDKEKTQYLEIGKTYYFDRNNVMQTNSDACHRWFLKVKYYHDNTIDVDVGRVLTAGETFYVNGVRYDIPAIFVEQNQLKSASSTWGLKYITFQTPLPKCDTQMWFGEESSEGLDANVNDWSHVTSQWLANLLPNKNAWVLPPFNEMHWMVDDIGLEKYNNGWYDSCGMWNDDYEVPECGLLLESKKSPLQFKYVDENIETRFDSSLAELLWVDIEEYWTWASVYSLPNQYTEFVLPDQEVPEEKYVSIATFYPPGNNGADGNEYLLTSSFIAENSEVDLKRWDLSKLSFSQHEIYDREIDLFPMFIGTGDVDVNKIDETKQILYFYFGEPRMVFEYDASDGTDLYINEQGNDPPSIRMYGENNVLYPTNSWSNDDSNWKTFIEKFFDWSYLMGDFVYPNYLFPFYPGAIPKDSITFNPAFMDMKYGDEEITASGGDASEKVFLRMFYEPGYTHDIDKKMKASSEAKLEPVESFDAIVLETTYFLVDHYRYPLLGKPGETWFMLPYQSNDSDTPGMDTAGIVHLAAADCGPQFKPNDGDDGETKQMGNVRTDGNISVEKMFYDVGPGDSVSFMDHTLTFDNYELGLNQTKVTVTYDGNMYGAHNKEQITHLDIGTTYYFNRNNVKQTFTDPAHRWYVNVTYYHEDTTQTIDVVLGRVLSAGETFYVNGVRYDIPAIYVDEMNGGCGFKFITLQTPLPKCDTQMWFDESEGEGLDRNVNDWSHVTSQWLANVLPNTNVWVLPPFDEDHTMLDDIGLIKQNTGSMVQPDWEVPYSGLVLNGPINGDVGPLEFKYIEEWYEPRFDTSIAERFYPEVDAWRWWSIYTMPNRYTEFILPNQETKETSYVIDEEYSWYMQEYADGNEYLLTSSWWAQNSWWPEIGSLSKLYYDSHDIFDIYEYMISVGPTPSFIPRFTFEFDAEDGTGIYLNKIEENGGEDETMPPTAVADAIDYSCGTLCITFDASGSYDNDQSGFEIEQYRWDFDDDGTYDTSWLLFSDPTYEYCYPSEYNGQAKLQVKDNEGETNTDVISVDVKVECPETAVIMEDCEIVHPGQGFAKIWISDVENLGAFEVTLSFDKTVVTALNVRDSDFSNFTYNIDNDVGEIYLNGYAYSLTGDFNIAYIDFESAPESSPGDSCPAESIISNLYDNTTDENPIPHDAIDGMITLIGATSSGAKADFSGNGLTNINDVRYLALYLVNKPEYLNIHGCNLDINCNGVTNIADVRYLAMYLANDPLYSVLYPMCDPFL